MRKYYYYTFECSKGIGFGVSLSENGEFDILGEIEIIKKEHSSINNGMIVINNWKEISASQYEKIKKNFDSQNK